MRSRVVSALGALACCCALATSPALASPQEEYLAKCGDSFETKTLLVIERFSDRSVALRGVVNIRFQELVKTNTSMFPSLTVLTRVSYGDLVFFVAFFIDDDGCSYHHQVVSADVVEELFKWQEGLPA